MRVAVIIPYSVREITGIGTVAEMIARRGLSEDIETHWIVPRGSGEVMLDLPANASLSEVVTGRFAGLRNFALALGTFVRLATCRPRPDVVHAHSPHLQTLASLVVARALGIPSIVTFHGTLPRSSQVVKAIVQLWTERVVLRVAQVVTAVCDATRSRLPRPDVIVIHNGVEVPPPAPDRHETGNTVSMRAIRLAYAGRFAHSKGIDILLECHRRLTRIAGPPIILMLIGGSNPLELEGVRQQVHNMHMEETVEISSAIKKYQRLLGAGDIYVSPSLYEGLPLTLLDAMAAGLAPVATEVGGVPEVIRHEIEGLLVPAGDVQALTNACLRLITDEGVRRKFGRSSRDRVLRDFTAEKMSRRYIELYRSAIAVSEPKP